MKTFKSHKRQNQDMEVMTAYKAEKLLSKYVHVSRSILTTDVEEALAFAEYPIALKLISPQALHKTELKGVRIVHNKQDLLQQFGELLKIALQKSIKLEGILVQDFEEGSEAFVGIKKDPTFGHVIGLGVGGIFVEAIKDVEWRACPITKKDADSMLEHLKYKDLLKGVRNGHNNVEELKKTLIKLSQVPAKYPHLQEMDVNPLIVNHKRTTVVDARIVFE
jgi:succinyl-CoA synthetase beta subunit